MIETDGEGKFKQLVTTTVPDLDYAGIQIPPPVIDGTSPGGGGGGGGGGAGGNDVCGQATQNTKVFINAQRTVVTIFNQGFESKYQVTQQQNSQILPGGIAYIGVANLSFMQGLSAATTVSFIVHPGGTGRLSYLKQNQWLTFGGGGNFQLF
jgi:hypothetical protein